MAPLGREPIVAIAYAVLRDIHPDGTLYDHKLANLFSWILDSARVDVGPPPLRGGAPPPSVTAVMLGMAEHWPSHSVVEALTERLGTKSKGFQELFRKDYSQMSHLRGAREAERGVRALVRFPLRQGRFKNALAMLRPFTDRPGDAPHLRTALKHALEEDAEADDYGNLARAFLPPEFIKGTAQPINVDLETAFEVFRQGTRRFPKNIALLRDFASLARLAGAPYLALRLLDDARELAVQQGANDSDTGALELASFTTSIQLLAEGTLNREDHTVVEKHARDLHSTQASLRGRYQNNPKLAEALDLNEQRLLAVDFGVAEAYRESGHAELALPILERLRDTSEGRPEQKAQVRVQLAKLIRQTDSAQAAIPELRAAHETLASIPSARLSPTAVETHAQVKMELGTALSYIGRSKEAASAWKAAAEQWGRLRAFRNRNRDTRKASKAAMELGKLNYMLGNRDEAMADFDIALQQSRDGTANQINTIAFLVRHGEHKAASQIFDSVVNRQRGGGQDYQLVYASMWVLDMSNRGQSPNAAAWSYLERIVEDPVPLRPSKASRWYVPLAKFALGRQSFDDLLPLADTPGRKAELFFYEAMRAWGSGDRDRAYALWKRVVETKMVSFFEFEMAAHYLRVGVPTHGKRKNRSGPTLRQAAPEEV